MRFSLSLPRRAERVSSDSAGLSFDLLSQLTYMAALAASYATRDKIFEHAIHQAFKTAVYFRQVYLLTKRLGFEYSRAFQLVAKRAKADTVRALLLRFASSINSGESELGFLTQEAKVEREIYTADYLRRLDTLQKWTDAYAALIVSVTVIIVVIMVSAMLYDMGTAFITMLALMAICITFFGSYVINKAAPYEIKPYRGRRGPRYRRLAVTLFLLGLPLGAAGAALAALHWGPGVAFLAFGGALLPSGVLAFLDDMAVNKLDQEVAAFVRTLGNIAGSLGSTLSVAVNRLDRRSMGHLEPYVHHLQKRLNSGLSPAICWDHFRDDVGSELVNRTTRMLVDGVELGGSPDRVGEIASEYGLTIALLRAKRDVASSTFAYLAVPLHAALISLLAFILEVMRAFSIRLAMALGEMRDKVSGETAMRIPSLPMFESRDLEYIGNITMVVIIAFTVANSVTPLFATGGHPVKAVFYGSLMCILTGLSLMVIPPMARSVLFR